MVLMTEDAKTPFNILDGERNLCADHLHGAFKRYGVDFSTGLPCGALKHIIQNLSTDPDILHIPATREAEAIGISAGAYLAGKTPVVYMQNSGLFDSSNEIGSLLIPYKIPVLLAVAWRGAPGETAVQHFATGKATMPLLEALEIPYKLLEKESIDETVSYLFEAMEEKEIPVAMVIKRGWYVSKEETL